MVSRSGHNSGVPGSPISLTANPFLHFIDEITRLHGRLQSLFERFHEQTGLGRFEHLVLTAVEESRFPPTSSQIGRSLGYPRQTIQRAANNLMAAGLLRKLPNPDHKRAPLLAATERGAALKKHCDRLALTFVEHFLAASDRDTFQRVAKDLTTLRRDLETYLRQRPPGKGGDQ